MSEQEASHYDRAGELARCRLCPHRCEIASDARGRCNVRENLGGILYATNYQELASLDVTAVERLPLFHWHPGARALAVGSFGDSFPTELAAWRAPADPDTSRWATAQEVADIAASHSVVGVAFAGGEPFMWLEEWRELAAAARADGLASLVVTNGYALAAARAEVAPLLDAANLVLLGDAETYRRRGLDPAPPRDFAAELRALGAHVELSLVVLPGENDGSLALDEVAALAARLDAPIHVTSPVSFELAAPVKTMLRVAEDLRARAPHVYLSTMYGGDPTTRCSRCKAVLVERTLARTTIAGLKPDGTCAACGAASPLRS